MRRRAIGCVLVALSGCGGEEGPPRPDGAATGAAGGETLADGATEFVPGEPLQVLIRERFGTPPATILVNGEEIGETPFLFFLDDLRECFDPAFADETGSFAAMEKWSAGPSSAARHVHELELPGLLVACECRHDPPVTSLLLRVEEPDGVVAGGLRLEFRGPDGRPRRKGGWSSDGATDGDGERGDACIILTVGG